MTATLTEKGRPLTLKAMTATDLMTQQVVSVTEDAPLRDAIVTFVDRGFSGAPVVNDAGRAVGVISLSDIVVYNRNNVGRARPMPEFYSRSDLRTAAGEELSGFQIETVDRTRVRDVMTPAVIAVRPDASAREVIEEMLLLRVHRLFVIDRHGVLVGVVSMSDILRALIA